MKLTALAAHTPEAVRAALAARGWDGDAAGLAAAGAAPLAFVIDDLPEPEREALAGWALRAGLTVLTGEGWGLVAGPASRLAVLARPDRAPPELAPLAPVVAPAIAALVDPPRVWQLRGGALALDRPRLMGIVNVTPDSFSDGGRHSDPAAAIAHAERLVADGADLVDVGGESTRPGAPPVGAADEIARVVPVIAALAARGTVPVSVDTRKAAVARAALDAGAAAVNDVSGLAFDPTLAGVAAAAGAGLVVMHMRGEPATMDARATYRHVAGEVAAELAGAVARALAAGVPRERIAVDPGFGFAKTAEQNWRLLDELAAVAALGYPLVVGPSRKRFLGAATGRPVTERDRATGVACALAWERGARVFRVHDVALTREALALAAAARPSA